MEKDTVETHESYGVIGASRITGTVRTLFGSSITHGNSVRLTIKRAEKHRSLSRNWYYGRGIVAEVEMSPTQFAEMITSMNIGDGVPCTLRYTNNYERIADPPDVSQRQVFEEEFENKIETIERLCHKGNQEIEECLLKKGTITVSERKKVANTITKLMRIVDDSIPFLQKSFNEAMDKTVNEAKGEVEAFVMNKVTSLGIEKMKDDLIQLQETTEKEILI